MQIPPLLFIDPNGKEIIIHYKDANGENKSVKYTPGIKPGVDNKFVQAVHESISATMSEVESINTYLSVAASKKPLNIVEITDFNNRTDDWVFDNPDNPTKILAATVFWNPNLASETSDGEGNSPATILFHEIVHGERALGIETTEALIKFFIEDKKDNGTDYHNNEEYRTVKKEVQMVKAKNKSEQNKVGPYGKAPQEGMRNDHNSKGPYRVNKPTDITPADPSKTIKNSKLESSGLYERQVPRDNTRVAPTFLPPIKK